MILNIGSLDDFPPDVVEPGTPFCNLSIEHIHSRIASHKTTLARLENLVFHHRRAIARYHSSLNEVIPSINKLPTEILSEIFDHCRTIYGYYNMPSQPGSHLYTWFKVAHVCRCWRNIVIANPSLFNRLQLSTQRHPCRTKEFLRLSKRVPLHIILSFDNPPDSLWKEFTPLIPRTRTLSIHLPELARQDWKWPTFPELTCLKWCPDRGFRYGAFDRDISEIMPKLQYLQTCIEIFGREWSSHSLPRTLKTLILSHVGVGRIGHVNNILVKLVELPQLENLSLAPDYHDYISQSHRKSSHLGHLKNLRLRSSISTILLFLEHVGSVDRITLAITGGKEDMWLKLPEMLKTKLTPVQPGSTRLKHMYDSNKVAGNMSMSQLLIADVYDTFPYTSHHIEIHTTLSILTRPGCLAPFCELLTSALASHFALVTTCRLGFNENSGNFEDCSLAMQTILGRMPAMTALQVALAHPTKTNDAGYIGAPFPTILAPNQENGINLPNLHELIIEIDSLYSFDDTFWRNLGVSLWKRKENDMALRILRFESSRRGKQLDSDSLSRVKSLLDPLVGDLVIMSTEE